MLRYSRLFIYFLRFSFSRAMEFRLDFFFRIFMDIFYYAVNILFYEILFLHTPYLAGWDRPQIYIFISTYLMIDALNMTLFSNNMWWLPVFINRGDLDYYLTRPVSSLFFLSFRDFAANSFINLLMAIAILAWAMGHYPHPVSLLSTLLYFAFLLNGVFLYYALRLIFILPIFWTHSNRGLDQIFWGLGQCMERPDAIFRGPVRIILTTLMPFALMASFPARIFFSGPSWSLILHLLGVSLFFFLLLNVLWRKGLSSYSSASS